jgi:hypothetical protein
MVMNPTSTFLVTLVRLFAWAMSSADFHFGALLTGLPRLAVFFGRL